MFGIHNSDITSWPYNHDNIYLSQTIAYLHSSAFYLEIHFTTDPDICLDLKMNSLIYRKL